MGYLLNTAVNKAVVSTDAARCKTADTAKAINVSELVLKEVKRLADEGQITFASKKKHALLTKPSHQKLPKSHASNSMRVNDQ